ncbi:MAG: DEAD/DEAH box helicase family protein [Minisyncoccus archaeiphilus]|uniref:type III restriction-modification system endonuclease n=1 Tax=Minisyncoccus archaeiphilus TaxID=3238481 RepID=UPI002B174D39|nr:MAG: DEAD/DEAH box helicase family protein [Candidatus Parcubacteria bacterium]
MKLKFKQQQYQAEATNAVVRVFAGQEKGFRKETVGRSISNRGGLFEQNIIEEIFSNKKLNIGEEKILSNTQEIQREQGLKVSRKLEGLNFSIEMETGTGKTYVYIKTMFELNKEYGWNKFIIMVPSVAIREGVHKSLQITAEHFQEIYGKKIRFFIYDSKNKSNLTNIKSFASTSNIEVIVMNYQAFGRKGKDALKMFQRLDEMQSEKPIDVIKRARPILIIDEPQRFGETAESMLSEFNPLFILRYSATHRKDYNKIYRLDAIDAYNQKLVKKIKVKGIEVKGNTGTSSYLFLDRIHVSHDKYPSATVQMEIETKQIGGIKKVLKRIKEGDNLFSLSGEMAQYDGYVVKEINALTNTVSFINGVIISVGQVLGDVDELHVRTIQIREAIASHIEKEKELFYRGIKVLTLFFIDEVSKYRAYDENGNQIKSDYEEIFEREYANAIAQKELFREEYYKYLSSFDVKSVHNGYFSIDKKGRAINSTETRGQEGSDDVSAYDLIMKDKERLLSFKEPTRFIFSHSALREGWDNPNIFQICTLKHNEAVISKRQEIGRGLRIAVDENGDRMDYDMLEDEFFDINALTVIASESYDSFAKQLQKEILDTLSDRPNNLGVDVFKGRVLKNKSGETFTFDDKSAMDLIIMFRERGYIDSDYRITDKLVDEMDKGSIDTIPTLSGFTDELIEILQKIYATNTFKSSEDDRVTNIKEFELKPNENFAKKEFQELWNKIKVKTVYDVSFDGEELVNKSINAINQNLNVNRATVRIITGIQKEEITESDLKEGSSLSKTGNQIIKTESILGSIKYDLIGEVAKGSNITRKTAGEILMRISPDKFALFQINPEHFIREVVLHINEQKAATLIDNITYHKTSSIYEDDIFTVNNFQGSLSENILEVKKHIYKYVKTDSEVERRFASELDLEDNKVLVYAKLPNGFKIPTPVGNYNPDWAIVFDSKDVKYIYFIAETKGSMNSLQLKGIEKQKIDYARKHFELLSNSDIKYDVIDNYDSLMNKVMK